MRDVNEKFMTVNGKVNKFPMITSYVKYSGLYNCMENKEKTCNCTYIKQLGEKTFCVFFCVSTSFLCFCVEKSRN